ncbi:MAG: tRNA (adenosine(37)-N6)-threonylcarbamoyltransferase complex transferase subunit TsaD [Clostridia bacterium]|nr:tRNA (adenosine(37)-N6)-threonylcarbamoyltransferase complex transferase subunit TsaD [Clostridia bacterium]
MLILGIESSCDETAAAVVEMSESVRVIRSSVVSSQVDVHALYGGVVPEIASRAHIEAVTGVVEQALRDAGVTMEQIDAVGVTNAPGLIGSLLVGVSFAKGLALAYDKPLVAVNHIKGHAAAAYLSNTELLAPFCALIVSGGHTSLYDVPDPVSYIEIGGTRDDAAGEAFDKVGRVMGLPYPGGAAMDRLAQKGRENGRTAMFRFPSPAVGDESYDYSFSGLKTAVINQLHTIRQRLNLPDDGELPEDIREGIAVCFTDVVTDGVCQKLRRAITERGIRELVLAGGVAANSHLRRAVESVARETGVRLTVPPLSLCGDNAAMIAAQAYFEYQAGRRADSSLNAFASDEYASFV